jgi:gas vesicle protein
MSNPDVIREQIEATRSNLSSDVNALADTVNPAHVAKRQVEKVRSVAGSAKDKVMGAASDAGSRAGSAGSGLTDTVSGLSGTVTSTPQRIQDGASGSPLAAGLIAVGVGWLIGSLIPASRAEQKAAVSVKETAAPMISDVAKDAADSLKEPAQEAVESVKSTATDAVATVKDEGSSSVDDVKQQAMDAKDTVQESR